MNKKVLLLCAFVVTFLFASNTSAVDNALGFKGGIGMSTLYGDGADLIDLTPIVGFTGGAFYELSVAKSFSIQ